MTYQGNLLSKTLVIGIIFLFIGIVVQPSIATVQKEEKVHLDSDKLSITIDWYEQAKLQASDGAYGDHFGDSVSLDGDTALIGAPWDDDNGMESGSAYVFKRNGTNWFEEAKLIASDGEPGDGFGLSVSLDGDTALIGAFQDQDNDYGRGSAYVFNRNGTIWTEQVNLRAAYEGSCDWFGDSVSLDGDTALIGAEYAGDVNGGVAYIFEKGLGPDLDCFGSLSFSDVSPGVTIEGNFTVENIGEVGSNLEWEITEYPEWGNWTFALMSGVGLTPEIGLVKVNFTVIAPDNETEEFSGRLKVINKHDRDDYYIIPVYLKTPRSKPSNFNFNLLSWLFERFPLLEVFLRAMNLLR